MEDQIMNVKIKSLKFSPTQQLETFVENKVRKLGHFYDDIIGAEVFLKLENTQDMENKIAEIKVEIPGNELFVKKQSKSFEQSTDSAIDALKKQIVKAKEKRRSM
jgi:putative sigma-54 modulation protein